MKINVHFILLLFTLILLTSCHASKKTSVKKEKKTVSAAEIMMQKVMENEIDAQWLSVHAKIKAKDSKQSQNFNADIRMKKDSIFWVTIYPPFLKISVAQALITKDSIKVLDRINKKYYVKNIGYLEELVNYPLDFNSLQGLILGNAITSFNETTVLTNAENTCSLNTKEQQLDMALHLDNQAFTIREMCVADSSKNQSISVKMSNYKDLNDKKFAHRRVIDVKTPDTYHAEIDFSKIKINEPLSFPFKASRKYEKIR
ncbi:MAG: DUF4292 domain-containing protein [Chitinophagales bacterium]